MEQVECCVEIMSDKNQIPAFEVVSEFDFKALVYYNKYCFKYRLKKLYIAAILVITITVLAYIFKYFLIGLILCVVSLVLVSTIRNSKLQTKEETAQKPNFEERQWFCFYDDHFTVKFKSGAGYINYTMITQAVETGKYFILYTTNGTAYIISVDNIATDFSNFIKEKFADKYSYKSV